MNYQLARVNWRCFAFAAFVVFGVSVFAQAQDEQTAPENGNENSAGVSVIRGRVVQAESRKPVRRAQVELLAENRGNGPAHHVVVTNERGEFAFKGLSANGFLVNVNAPGFRFQAVKQDRGESSNQFDRPFITVDGMNTVDITIQLQRGAAISGRVTYADGEPVVRSRLVLFQKRGTQVTEFDLGRVFTNDRGEYRIAGLPAGAYLVGVAEDQFTGRSWNSDDDDPQPSLPAAYYPNANSTGRATPVELGNGTEVRGIDIALTENKLHTISGHVKWKGAASSLSGIRVEIVRTDDPTKLASFGNTLIALVATGREPGSTMRNLAYVTAFDDDGIRTNTDSNGSWSLKELAAGDYRVKVTAELPRASSNSTGNDGAEGYDLLYSAFPANVVKEIDIAIADRDISSILIELAPGSSLTGTVSGAEDLRTGMVEFAGVSATTGEPITNPRYNRADGSFQLKGLPPGRLWLNVASFLRQGHYVKSVRWGNQDLLREPIEIADGVDVRDVQVRLASDVATLAGTVTNDNGQTAAGVGILVMESDPRRWSLPSSAYFALAGLNGEFTMTLPPGDYLVMTWQISSTPYGTIRAFVERHAAKASRLSLGSSEQKQVDLRVMIKE